MIEFYRERARGGIAMIVLDCPCLDFPKAYKGPNELRFDTPEFAGGIRTLLNTIHLEGRSSFDFGTNIVILGGGDIGCETADLLSSQAKNITIVERSS
jgi:thioredoxin reductase